MNSSHYLHDSLSSPNLARHRQTRVYNPVPYHGSSQTNLGSTSQGSTRQMRPVHGIPEYNRHVGHLDIHEDRGYEKTNEDGRECAGNGAKMSRSERKRLWRKNLSAEKLAKLRERDALRKRVERMNMSAEKRRDLRTKDTARKAALRKERRMNESIGSPHPSQGIEATSTDTDNNNGSSGKQWVSRNERDSNVRDSYRRTLHRRGSGQDSSDDEFTKIPVQSLLN